MRPWNSSRRRDGKKVMYSHWSHRAVYSQHSTGIIAQFPISQSVHCALAYKKNNILALISSLRHWTHFPHLFKAPLPTALWSTKRPQTVLCAPLWITILFANSCMKWCGIFKGLDGPIFFAFLFNKELWNETNLAWSNSLERTFKRKKIIIKFQA